MGSTNKRIIIWCLPLRESTVFEGDIVQLFIHATKTYLVSHVPGTILGAKITAMNKIKNNWKMGLIF